MCQARIAALSFGLVAVAITPVLAAGPEPADRIVKSVERMADKHTLDPSQNEDTVCRWATQTMTYQGVSHTRRVRVCEKQSWWEDLVRKAKASTSRSRPRPG